MTSISSNFGRAPNLMMSQVAMSAMGRANLGLYRVQAQLATGIAVSRFSDDAVKAAAISVLDGRIERSAQRQRNISHADSSLNTIDQALAEASELIQEARSIASAQVGSIASPAEREAHAHVLDSLIQSLFALSNRQSVAGHIFAGSTPGSPAVAAFRGGYRYVGSGPGLLTDLGIGSEIPITLGAGNIVGSTSARIEGTVDLQPGLVAGARLSELGGARGLGIQAGRIEFAFADGPRASVDLSGADSIQDVINTLSAAIREYEAAHAVAVLGPGGIALSGRGINIDVVSSGGIGVPQLMFYDIGSAGTAADLGLGTFSASTPQGEDLHPALTWLTPLSSLNGLGGPLGSIRINNMGQSRVVDLSSAETLEDVRNLIEGTGLGVRVEINTAGTGLNVVNQVAAGRGQALSIEEVAGSNPPMTATRLGIRSLSEATRLSDFNDGRGVRIITGSTDPLSGAPDPLRDADFAIRLGDAAQRSFTVDLRPQDLATVQTLLARINEQAMGAGINVPADFEAALSDGGNGIMLRQNAAYAGPISISAQNNSPAAGDLGFLDGAFESATGTFRAADRAQVRIDNLFAHLIDLRDALRSNDTTGITLAGERLEQAVDRLSQTRALVGGYARRVQDASRQQEDQTLLDQKTRSLLRDTDFTEAAVRLSMLQMQLQGAMAATAQSLSRSLLDFLG
jgi:flagellin-like hook-associated protein FlgL